MHRSIYLKDRYSAAARVRAVEAHKPQNARYILPLVFILEGLATLLFMLSGGGLSFFSPHLQDTYSLYVLLAGMTLMGIGLFLWFRTFGTSLRR